MNSFDFPRKGSKMWTKPDFPYGQNWPDTDLWADEDGVVRHGDGSRMKDQRERNGRAEQDRMD
jgi:hypothetical protein